MRIALAIAAFLSLTHVGRADDTPAPTAAQVDFYQKEVRPILEANCARCHGKNPEKLRGGLNLTHRAGLLQGGDSGPGVDLKNPAASMLLKAVGYKNADETLNMPPSGKLADAEIVVLTKWVDSGAAFDGSASEPAPAHEVKPKKADPNYWAFRPVVRPQVPEVKGQTWAKTPVDRFILAKLEEKGITPNGPADKLALLRRATYDLTGLPPTVAEVDAYLADQSPDAYERLIDRLLASPAYGEKWGRHWLDLVRYAESNGYERDGTKPYAWRYRDYVIDSFNRDKPYTEFLTQQIAGDERPNPSRDDIIATGFYKLGVWDDEPADRDQALYDGYDDLVSVIGQGVLGLTFNCARCHDHKGDFFPTSDYYKLVALVRDVGPYSGNRGGNGNLVDITSATRRKEYEPALKQLEAKLDELAGQMRPIEDRAIKRMPPKDQLAVEDGHRERIVRKVPQYLKGDETEQYAKLRAEFKRLKFSPRPDQEFALAVKDAPARVEETHVLIRGGPQNKGKVVQPGFPEVFGVPDPVPAPTGDSSGRRTALAKWLTSPTNPMTARVMVNRVWQHHFGKGIVPTSNDFGKFGEKPTAPGDCWTTSPPTSAANGWTLKAAVHKSDDDCRTRLPDNRPQANPVGSPGRPDQHAALALRHAPAERRGGPRLDLAPPAASSTAPSAARAFTRRFRKRGPGNGQSGAGLTTGSRHKGGGYDPAHPERGNRRSVYVTCEAGVAGADLGRPRPGRHRHQLPRALHDHRADASAGLTQRRVRQRAGRRRSPTGCASKRPTASPPRSQLAVRLDRRPHAAAGKGTEARRGKFVAEMQSKHKLSLGDEQALAALRAADLEHQRVPVCGSTKRRPPESPLHEAVRWSALREFIAAGRFQDAKPLG